MLPDACYFVDEPPEFTYAEGLFHVAVNVGGRRIERVMRPHVFMLALRKAAEAAREHRFDNIIDFPAKEDEAASH